MKKIRITREANWYGLFNTLELYADGSDELELGEIAAGETIELALSADVTHVYGEMSGVPTEWLSTAKIKDGDTIVIRSIATISNFFSTQQIPLVFRILTPGEFVDIGSKKQKTRSIIKAFGISIFLMFATIAWIKEGWRLSGYDTKQQMEVARAGGFSDKETLQKAQAVGVDTADEWENLLAKASDAGFDDAKEFIQFRDGKFISKDEFTKAKAAGAHTRREWLADPDWQELTTFPENMLSIYSSDKPCEIIKSRYWETYPGGPKAGHYRSAPVTIVQPFHKKRYFLLLQEFFGQRDLLVEDILKMWRSKKDSRYYLAYYAVNAFELYYQDDTGVFKRATPQLNGAAYTSDERFIDSVDVMNRVKPRRSPDEYRKWGIIPDSFEEGQLLMCDRRNYQTIENVRFVDKETGRTATISELLSRKTLDERAPVRVSPGASKDTRPVVKSVVAENPKNSPREARNARIKNWSSVMQRISYDYPSRALREKIQGTVQVKVIVTVDGRPTRCSVTASSGSDILDSAACKAVEQYARFEPALDYYGNRTEGAYTQKITYKIN